MWNDTSNNKKYAYIIAVIVFLIFFHFYNPASNVDYVYAKDSGSNLEQELNESLNGVLDDIDSSSLDEFLPSDFGFDFLSGSTFKDLAVSVLNGNYFNEYDSLLDFFVNQFKENISKLLMIIIMFLSLVLIGEMFNNFCVDKYAEIKKSIKLIFSLFIVMLVAYLLKDVATKISTTIKQMIDFSGRLFPILLSLVSLSGAIGSHSAYSSISIFLLNTCSYIFVYVLLPISISVMVLSLVGSIFSNKRFEKTIGVFKWIFKIVISIMFGILGVLSIVNLVTVGVKDGVSVKLTKFAIKNYIPVLGGYISEGFDFLKAGSVLIKNAFGICGIFLLLFLILKPLILYILYIFIFKILSLLVAYLGVDFYSDMFDNVSKCAGCLLAVLIGVFLIVCTFIFLLIISVSVV